MNTSRNLAGRMGRWSARHRKTAVLGWLAFVALAVVLGGLLPRGEITPAEELLGAPAAGDRPLPVLRTFHGVIPLNHSACGPCCRYEFG